jgi:LPXTG-motif cell wall-anchored protein
VPGGTEAVGVDEFCGIPVYAPDGTIFDVQTGKPGGRFYLCGAAGFLARGDTTRFTFRLRIEQATTTAGEVSLSDNSRQYPAWVGDDVSGNDDAPVTVTVVAGGGDGGGGAGDGGSLPITGVATGALAAAGGALLLAGLALVLLTRRRRVTVHSE